MTRNLRTFAIILFTFGFITAKAQFTVQNETNAVNLAQKILGPGITILNAQFKGADISAGTFSAIQGSFPITSGIVLSSGRVKTTGTGVGMRGVDGLANYNQSDNFQASTSNNTAGDLSLNTYSGKTTLDAAVLEFDFIPQGDSINVNYIFGSEEYPNYTCSDYNDVFAFLITGPGFSSPTNIALVPNTNIPVAINSINDGVVGTAGGGTLFDCTKMGTGSPFTQYYISNNGGLFLTYNGRTVVLTAKAKVQPCQVYHIKLAIADAEDRILDSGVFIEAGSFSSKTEFTSLLSGQLVNANNEVVLVEGCKSAQLKLTRSAGTVGPFSLNVTYGGTATPNTDFIGLPSVIDFAATETEKIFQISAPADAFAEGTEKAVMYFSKYLACTQQLADSAVIYIQDSLVTKAKKDTFLCGNSSIIIKSKDPVANTANTYMWNNGSATQSILVSQAGTYYVAHTYSQRCVEIDTFAVKNLDPTFSVNNPSPIVCDGSPAIISVTTNADSIKWNTGATTNALTVSIPGQYWVQVKNIYGCSKADTFQVAQRPSPLLELGKDTSICPDESIVLDASFSGATYVWNTGATTASIIANKTGVYIVSSTANGCTSRDTITIDSKKIPVADAGPDLTVAQFGSIKLNAKEDPNNGSYLWTPAFTLSNPLIHDPIATPTVSTEYTVKVTSVDGCVLQDKVFVTIEYPLNIPNAFSPNGDGINDKWNIGNIHFYPESKVYIFNRYGQQVFFSKGYRNPWDGNYKGQPAQVATYYYVIEPGDGRRFGGWVVLLK